MTIVHSAASIKFALIIRCVYPCYILRLLLLYLRVRDSQQAYDSCIIIRYSPATLLRYYAEKLNAGGMFHAHLRSRVLTPSHHCFYPV